MQIFCKAIESILSQIHVCSAFNPLLLTHNTCMCVPLVGHTCTYCFPIKVTVKSEDKLGTETLTLATIAPYEVFAALSKSKHSFKKSIYGKKIQ